DRRIARVIVFGRLDLLLIATVFAHEALETGPGLNQGAIGRKMFVAGPAFLSRKVIDLSEEQFGDLCREHSLIVLGEDTVVEATLAELTVQEPEPKQIVAQLLTEKPFATNTVEGDKHARLEQLLGWDTWSSLTSVQLVEQRRKFLQDC